MGSQDAKVAKLMQSVKETFPVKETQKAEGRTFIDWPGECWDVTHIAEDCRPSICHAPDEGFVILNEGDPLEDSA